MFMYINYLHSSTRKRRAFREGEKQWMECRRHIRIVTSLNQLHGDMSSKTTTSVFYLSSLLFT